MLHSKQIDQHFDADGHLRNLTMPAADADSFDLTAAVTAFANVAGRNGTEVPVQVATDIDTQGFVTYGIVQLSDTNDKPMADSSGNEIYGKLTELAGAYTLLFFSRVGTVETAFTMPRDTVFNAVIGYRFQLHRLPPSAMRSPLSVRVSQDPTSAGAVTRELLVIATVNTVPKLAATPRANTCVLHVNGQRLHVGLVPGLTIKDDQITWASKPVDHDPLLPYLAGAQVYQAGALYAAIADVAAGPFVPAEWAAATVENYVGYDLEPTDTCVAECTPG